MPALATAAREKLHELSEQSRRRSLVESVRGERAVTLRGSKKLVSFSCNDYLGLSQRAEVKRAAIEAIEKYGTGAGASRLVTGNHPLYASLEAKLAAWKGTEAALVFGSGYLANIGVIPALVGRGDLILADRLVHACLIDAALLSGAKLMRFKHNDPADCGRILSAQRAQHDHCLIITDEVFSMDGDLAPLDELANLAKAHDAWLLADGAHSISAPRAKVDIYVGTLSKALGSYGGFVAASRDIVDYLTTTARSLIFSTGLPPANIAAAEAALDLLRADTALGQVPLAHARLFTKALGLPEAQSPIVPLILKDETAVLAAAAELEAEGFLVAAIRPPTVPAGTSRLRFAFSAMHEEKDVVALVNCIRQKGWV